MFQSNNSNVGIHSLVAIPLESWSLDYIKPKPVCIRKDGVCIQSSFPNPPESKKIQFEQDSDENLALQVPVRMLNTTKYVFLNPSENMIDLRGNVPQPGYYVFVVQYYQPDFPRKSKIVAVVV